MDRVNGERMAFREKGDAIWLLSCTKEGDNLA